jgi:hypothetical protein
MRPPDRTAAEPDLILPRLSARQSPSASVARIVLAKLFFPKPPVKWSKLDLGRVSHLTRPAVFSLESGIAPRQTESPPVSWSDRESGSMTDGEKHGAEAREKGAAAEGSGRPEAAGRGAGK